MIQQYLLVYNEECFECVEAYIDRGFAGFEGFESCKTISISNTPIFKKKWLIV